MTGILLVDQTYQRLHRIQLNRRRLIARFLEDLPDCFPGLVVNHVNLIKYFDNEEFVVDLSFVDLDAGRWWTGAIFTEIYDFETEVAFPLYWMRRARFLAAEIAEMARGCSDEDRARELVSTTQPDAVAFVSNPRPEWFQLAAEHEGMLAVVESFKAAGQQREILRLNGQLPRAQGQHLATCRPIPGMSHTLSVDSTLGLDGECIIEWEDEPIVWHATPLDSTVLLRPASGTIDMSPDLRLALYELGPGRYALRTDA